MGIQQTYHRLRKLTSQHEFIVAYTNQEHNAEPQTCDAVPFRLVRLPNPVRRARVPIDSLPRIYWQSRAWYQALVARKPHIYREHHDPKLVNTIIGLVNEALPDVVHVVGEGMLMNLPPTGPRLLADFPDLFSMLFGRVRLPEPRRTHQWQHTREIQKIRRVEKHILENAGAALFVSEADRATALQIAHKARTFVVPNAVDLDFFSGSSTTESNLILFTGTLSYRPNIEALEFFVDDVLPRIRSVVPGARLEIVGYNPAPEISAMASECIRIYANVPDIRPYLSRAAICIAPILSGSGTRIKIIEAWAMRKAVVSTRLGAEGLEGADHKHLLIADKPGEFADAVGQLLQNPALRRELGENGHTLAERRYSLAAAAEELNRIYLSLGRRPE